MPAGTGATVSPLRRAADAIPPKLKPPIAVVLNLTLLSILHYLAAPWIGDDLRADRPLKTTADYSALVAWRTVEVLSYWLGGWDATQAASLSMLTIAPSLHYFHTYQPKHAALVPTLSVASAINTLSVYLPLAFLRPSTAQRRGLDQTRLVTSLLSASVYQLVLHSAVAKFLTTWLIGCGWDLQSVVRAHTTTEASLLARAVMMWPVGWAASELIFFSDGESEARVREKGEGEGEEGLWERIVRLWVDSLSPRTRSIIKRTLLVAAYQGAGATAGLVQTSTKRNLVGTAGVSGVWATATLVVGVILGWVGRA